MNLGISSLLKNLIDIAICSLYLQKREALAFHTASKVLRGVMANRPGV